MALSEEQVLQIVYPMAAGLRGRRLIQETPVLPDVWILFGTQPRKFHNLILTPHKHSGVDKLFRTLKVRTERETKSKGGSGRTFAISYNESHVVFQTDYAGLIRIVLPISWWWQKQILLNSREMNAGLDLLYDRADLIDLLTDATKVNREKLPRLTQSVLDVIRIVGCIGLAQNPNETLDPSLLQRETLQGAIRYFKETLAGLDFPKAAKPGEYAPLWNLFTDRDVHGALTRSRLAVKADAAIELFQIRSNEICWAVIDSGIDAKHPAFRVNDKSLPRRGSFAGNTRVEKTLDFNRLMSLTSITISDGTTKLPRLDGLSDELGEQIARDLHPRLLKGQPLDWPTLEIALEVPHTLAGYRQPEVDHGTHVAGILGANWKKADPPLIGICPDIRFYDLRVTDNKGQSNESVILSALQYVRYLNENKGRLVVHGVNMSLSLFHNVKSFACGRTPVCEEANRLVGNGIVVVAAAGNSGMGEQAVGMATDYRAISITDPGNAEDVITVGSTHNSMPHRFGVSYFSSRGPTGDGRMKPDLVAPGEQIRSTTPNNGAAVLDGTSMAAPHVSGAAALMMARHPELRGEPRRVKEILCLTATDLGRERSFQGAGLLDILRALQSV